MNYDSLKECIHMYEITNTDHALFKSFILVHDKV